MFSGVLFEILHGVVGGLKWPVIGLLLIALMVCIWEVGCLLGEGFRGLADLKKRGDPAYAHDLGRRRIERADLVARVGPMLGLMGTLIPLGPGIAALSGGNLDLLAAAVTTAFDSTVIGLAAGIIGYIIGRIRRRWYDNLLDAMDHQQVTGTTGQEETKS